MCRTPVARRAASGCDIPQVSLTYLATFQRLDDHIIFYFISFGPYFPNLSSLPQPHGLEEAPVVHQPGPGHLPEVG